MTWKEFKDTIEMVDKRMSELLLVKSHDDAHFNAIDGQEAHISQITGFIFSLPDGLTIEITI